MVFTVLEGTECLSLIQNIEAFVSEGLIRASVHGHAFGTLHICPQSWCRPPLSGVPLYTCIAFQSVALERIWMLQVCCIIRGGKVTALIRIM